MKMITPDIVILHCADTPDFKRDDPLFDKFGFADIDMWHRERGFINGCGYHFVVRRTGKIENGRICISPDHVAIGAHCSGENHRAIGICYVGRKEPTIYQIDAIRELYLRIKKIFDIDKNNWFAHHDFNPKKTCPGFPIEFIKNLLPPC